MFAQEITAEKLDGDEVPVIMSYDEDDPLAITFAFAEGDVFVEWDFARDLLLEAIQDGGAGIGDIRFTVEDDALLMTMHREVMWTAVFPLDEVQIFLEQTEKMVPIGEEEHFLNIDEEWKVISSEELES